MAFAARHGLDATATRDESDTLRSLTMKGRLDGAAVTLTYRPHISTRTEADATPVGDTFHVHTSSRTIRAYELVARATSPASIASAVRVTPDAMPTLRKVASWVGAGDPTVNDDGFDDRFLLEGDEAALREALPLGLRRALLDAVKAPLQFSFEREGHAVVWRCAMVLQGERALTHALAVLRAACVAGA